MVVYSFRRLSGIGKEMNRAQKSILMEAHHTGNKTMGRLRISHFGSVHARRIYGNLYHSRHFQVAKSLGATNSYGSQICTEIEKIMHIHCFILFHLLRKSHSHLRGMSTRTFYINFASCKTLMFANCIASNCIVSYLQP